MVEFSEKFKILYKFLYFMNFGVLQGFGKKTHTFCILPLHFLLLIILNLSNLIPYYTMNLYIYE